MREVRLKRGCERRVALGHLWVFSNEIQELDRSLPAGEDVAVRDARGGLLGSGTFSPSSLIAVRLHARGRAVPLDAELLRERVAQAWAHRQAWFGAAASACRAVYAEGDGLPGLIADRFGEYLSVQCLTAGMERRAEWVLGALDAVHRPRGIVLRTDSPARAAEGLDRGVAVARGEVPPRVGFELHGLPFAADLREGQKTGFFFDQRENYALLRPVARDAEVLDAYCYSGAWGLHALSHGARSVAFVDASAEALELARANAGTQGRASVAEFCQADVLEFLKICAAAGRGFDVAVLDPPAFAKSRQTARQALRGYLNLNKWGMRCVRPGGYLVTCSCSHHIPPEAFVEMLALAAREAGREVRVLGVGRQSPDHPWLPAMPETAYLKALLVQVQ
ncbi:MAG TPA: class I SAM-dependent rRNA methyltransferase [Deferrisomatales bacterium]|nr:class I SAM-dependent rRNA methyltransferase [Deferrisomatales bacterium]